MLTVGELYSEICKKNCGRPVQARIQENGEDVYYAVDVTDERTDDGSFVLVIGRRIEDD